MAMVIWQLFGVWWRYLGVNPNTRAQSDSQAFALFGIIALIHHHRSLLFEVPNGLIPPIPCRFSEHIISSSAPSMTIAVLRSLYAIIGSAIDDIERVYASSDHANSEASTSRHTPEGTSSTQTCTPDNETAIPEAGQKKRMLLRRHRL
jgi:hypothetical protein